MSRSSDELVLVQLHPAAGSEHLGQRAGHHAPGGVAARVDDPRHRVGAFLAQDELAVALVELGAQLLQFADARGTLLHQHAHGLDVAETDAGLERVVEVQVGRVVLAHSGGYAALSQKGGGLIERALGDEAHVPAVGRTDGGGQPRDAAADHEDVVARIADLRPPPGDERDRARLASAPLRRRSGIRAD